MLKLIIPSVTQFVLKALQDWTCLNQNIYENKEPEPSLPETEAFPTM